MIVVLGGSMLGAIIKWTGTPQYIERRTPASHQSQDLPAWVARIARRLEQNGPSTPDEAEYVAVLGGREIGVTGSQYGRLVVDKDDLLRDVELFVDKVVGNILLRTGETWTRLDFRIGNRAAGVRSGPFSLLSIYARHPGRRFTNGELRTLLEQELSDRASINVGDFISQLQRRRPRLPIQRDDTGSFLDAAVNVCLLDHRPPPNDHGT